jgi:hypothetical protein
VGVVVSVLSGGCGVGERRENIGSLLSGATQRLFVPSVSECPPYGYS